MSKMTEKLLASAFSLRETAHIHFRNANQYPEQKHEHLKSASRCLNNAILFVSMAKGIKKHAKTV
jgi:hypothetical protein